MRDSLLAVSGQLDRTIGGKAVPLTTPRRTLYVFVERQNLPGTFRTFDFANPDSTSPGRAQTCVPQQALFFMNSKFALGGRSQGSRSAAARTVHDLYALALCSRADRRGALARDGVPRCGEGGRRGRVALRLRLGRGDAGGREGPLHGASLLDRARSGKEGDRLPDKTLDWCLLHPTGGRPATARIAW